MMKIALLACSLMFALALSAAATEGPSVELGKSLFESTNLGSNGKSCATCHPSGKGLQNIGSYDDAKLKKIVNSCVQNALKGKAFSPDTQELDSLLTYLRTL